MIATVPVMWSSIGAAGGGLIAVAERGDDELVVVVARGDRRGLVAAEPRWY